MTEETNKLRALILTALMVTSVFAGTLALAGTAAAANSASGSISTSTAQEEASAEVTFTVNAEGLQDDGSADTVTIDIPDSVDTNEIVSVGGDASAASIGGDGNDIVVEENLGGDSATVEVTAEHTFPSVDEDVDADITATVEDSGGDDQTATLGTLTIENTEGSAISTTSRVFAGQALSGTADADAELELQVATSTNDEGEPIAYEFETAVSQDADGDYTLDTSGLEQGSYKVIDVSGTSSYEETFSLSVQSYSASADPASVTTAEGATELIVESNRNDYTHYVSSEDLDLDDLQTVLGDIGTQVDADGDGDVDSLEVLPGAASTEDVLNADFTDEDAGNYTIDFLVPDTGETASTTVEVEESAGGSADFVTKAISDEQGDPVTINVSISGPPESAQVTIGGPSVNYEETVTVTDGDDDGYVEFTWNTYLAGSGQDATFAVADSDDDITLDSTDADEVDVGELSDGEYPVSVSLGGSESGVATVALGSPTDVENSIQTWTAPDGADSLDDESEDYLFDQITTDDTIAKDDLLVLEVGTAGVYGQLAAADTGDLNDLEGTALTVTQTEDSTPTNTNPRSIDTSNAINIPDPATNTVFVLVDTADFDEFEVNDDTPVQEFEATLSYDASDGATYRDEDASATASFELVEASAEIDAPDDERLTVEQSANASVSGTSQVAAGTELTVTARSSGGQNPFLRTGTATVQDDGTWTADIDVSDIPTGTNFTVSVKSGNDGLDEVDATIGGAADVQLASLDAPETATPGETITVTATVENTGEASGETEVAFVFEGETVATQNVSVDAGSTAEVTFEAAVPEETGDYTHGVQVGDNEIVTAGITVQEEETTTEPTTTEPTTTEPTTTEPTTEEPTTAAPTTSEEPDDETTTEDTGGQPGFGVAVALVALLAAALLATRRNN